MSMSTLATQLTQLLGQPLETVEILPGGIKDLPVPAGEHYPFLLMDGHLGIPQKLLYAIYMQSSHELAAHRRSFLVSGTVTDGLIASTTLLIVANSAHQTAFNLRKQLIDLDKIPETGDLGLTAALLTGIKECAKSSIVWDHRRWIFRRLYSPSSTIIPEGRSAISSHSSSPLLVPLPLSIVERELQLIAKCCELYPRNYHAWSHWTFCMQCLLLSPEEKYADLADIEYRRLLKWVDRHVSDYSAMHCLCAMWDMFHKSLEGRDIPSPLDHSLGLLKHYDSHEAVQLYVRSCLEQNMDTYNSSEVLQHLTALSTFQQPRGRLLVRRLQEIQMQAK